MQPNGSRRRKHRGDDKRCELQHCVHEVPPVVHFWDSHSHDQSQYVDKKGLTERRRLRPCGDKHTPCRTGRAPLRSTRRTNSYRLANLSPHFYPTIDLTQPQYGVSSRSKPRSLTLPPGLGTFAKARVRWLSSARRWEDLPQLSFTLPWVREALGEGRTRSLSWVHFRRCWRS
jgi:hypothetical protein